MSSLGIPPFIAGDLGQERGGREHLRRWRPSDGRFQIGCGCGGFCDSYSAVLAKLNLVFQTFFLVLQSDLFIPGFEVT